MVTPQLLATLGAYLQPAGLLYLQTDVDDVAEHIHECTLSPECTQYFTLQDTPSQSPFGTMSWHEARATRKMESDEPDASSSQIHRFVLKKLQK